MFPGIRSLSLDSRARSHWKKRRSPLRRWSSLSLEILEDRTLPAAIVAGAGNIDQGSSKYFPEQSLCTGFFAAHGAFVTYDSTEGRIIKISVTEKFV